MPLSTPNTGSTPPPGAPPAPTPTPHVTSTPLIPADWTPGALWLAQGHANPTECLGTWRQPHALAPLRIGTGTWDVIRTDSRLGEEALRILCTSTTPGPVLTTGTEGIFLIPRLTTPWHTLLTGIDDTPKGRWEWGRGLTSHLAADSGLPLFAPQPGLLRRRKPLWLIEPDGSETLTLAGQLATALHQAYRAVLGPAAARTFPQAAAKRPTPANPTNFAAFARRPHNAEAAT